MALSQEELDRASSLAELLAGQDQRQRSQSGIPEKSQPYHGQEEVEAEPQKWPALQPPEERLAPRRGSALS